jgi:predicted aspartyl protease
MKHIALILFGLVAFVPAFAQANLEELYKNRQYFELREAVEAKSKVAPANYLFYRAVVANRFNDPKGSIGYLRKFLKQPSDSKFAKEGYEILADNYVKTYQYAKAAETYRYLQEKYKSPEDASAEAAYANLAGLWGALGDAPAQTVTVKTDSVIQGTRDKARLLNVPVEISGQKMDFVFDTGANLSTMTVSTASKLGLKIIESNVTIGSSTENKVKSKLAVAPELRLGNIVVRNAVFLVLEDASLSFPQINYQINAILGFPVMLGFGRMTLTKDDKIAVPVRKGTATLASNMLLDGLMPVAGEHNGKRMTFTFDTGATRSKFYAMFYEAASDTARAAAVPHKIRSGGAGGVTEAPGYKMKDVELNIGGKTARFAEIEVISEKTSERSRFFYGNLGQDLIKQHEKMTLDFRAMRLTFE